MNRSKFFQLLAGSIVVIASIGIYLLHTGILGSSIILPSTFALISAVALIYTLEHHDFESDNNHKRLLLSAFGAILLISVILIALTHIPVDSFTQFSGPNFDASILEESFLPQWWILTLLVPASLIVLADTVSDTETPSYTAPNGINELAESPVYFGFACAFLGFWGVLFVGINITQRIIVIAPFFEELLKFGVALFIGSAIFGRSMASRVAVAILVGSAFGLAEHALSYPEEQDLIYLFRVLFHTLTAMLTVGVYTMFEERGLLKMLWISPVYAVFIHFVYNSFVLASGVFLISVTGEMHHVVTLAAEVAVIIITASLVALTVLRHELIEDLHEPVYSVLKEVV